MKKCLFYYLLPLYIDISRFYLVIKVLNNFSSVNSQHIPTDLKNSITSVMILLGQVGMHVPHKIIVTNGPFSIHRNHIRLMFCVAYIDLFS